MMEIFGQTMILHHIWCNIQSGSFENVLSLKQVTSSSESKQQQKHVVVDSRGEMRYALLNTDVGC